MLQKMNFLVSIKKTYINLRQTASSKVYQLLELKSRRSLAEGRKTASEKAWYWVINVLKGAIITYNL